MTANSSTNLDDVLDAHNKGVSKHLGQIADTVHKWEGQLAEELELTDVDVATVKLKHPSDLHLQTREALKIWKQRLGLGATYHLLKYIFDRCGYAKSAETILRICGSPSSTNSQDCFLPKCVSDYQEILKEMYIEMVPFMEEDYPGKKEVPQEVTRVVLINNNTDGDDKKDSIRSESLEHDHAHGKIDSILAYKEEIDVSTVLDPVHSPNSNAPPKSPKVLMDGAPGVGKTTLTLSACKGWAEHRLFEQYDLVLLVPLRQASCREAKDIQDLFPGDDQSLKQEVVSHIRKYGGKNIAFIFDGYDELSFEQRRRSSLFMKLFCCQVLPKCAILVTSRPYSSGELLKLPSTNRHVEVLGFKKQQIYACIRRQIKSVISAESLISQLEERDDITSLCYIPLLCNIMIHVHEFQSRQACISDSVSLLPATVTELFICFLHDLLRRQVQVVESADELEEIDDCLNAESLIQKVHDRLDVLEHLAYECLVKDKFVFTQGELSSMFGTELKKSHIKFCCLGLITSSTNFSRNQEQHFQFVHLSIQEFLAARYICKTFDHGEVMDIIYQHIDDSRYRLFMIFVAGISKLKGINLQMAFQLGWKECTSHSKQRACITNVDGQNPWASTFLYYINLIFESQCFDKFDSLFNSLVDKSVINLSSQTMTQFECRILTHFLCSIDHSWELLDLRNCSLSVQSLKTMNSISKSSVSCHKTSFFHVNLSGNDPSMIENMDIFPWLNDVKALTFESPNYLVDKGIKSNLAFLAHIPRLSISYSETSVSTTPSKVTLCSVTLGEGFTTYLKEAHMLNLTKVDYSTLQMVVHGSFFDNIQVLEINEVDGLDGLISRCASKISSSKMLKVLTLRKINLTCVGALPLLRSLLNSSSIENVDLSSNPALAHGPRCSEIGHALKTLLIVNRIIKTLTLSNKSVSDQTAQYLIAGLKDNCTLERLNVTDNRLTVTTICNLSAISLKSSRLSQLIVQGLELQRQTSCWKLMNSRQHKQVLCADVFCVFTRLKEMCVDCVSADSISIKDLETHDGRNVFQALQQHKCIKTLRISNVEMKVSVGCAMEKMLTVGNMLQSIHFDKCLFGDSMLKFLKAGLARNVSIKELSLKHAQETSSIICVLQALEHNHSIETLDLSENGKLLIQCGNGLIISEFENLFKRNSILTAIILNQTCINDAIAFGFARGLSVNKSLKKLEVALSMLTGEGVTSLLLSSNDSLLSSVKFHECFSMSRNKVAHGWDFVVANEYCCWPLLQNFTCDKNCNSIMVSLKLNDFLLHRSYRVERIFCLLKHHQNLRTLDLSSTRISTLLGVDKGRDIGHALKQLLSSCSCLEFLILKRCNLPKDTWIYAADGLSTALSLKHLDISHCEITAIEAINIFRFLVNINELIISDNAGLMDIDYSSQLSDAIEKALTCSKLRYLNLKNSINDEVASKIAITLEATVSLERIEVSEQQLSCRVVQKLLLLMKDGKSSLTHLAFNEVSFYHSTPGDFFLNAINRILKKGNKFINPKLSSKLFCGLCSAICACQSQILVPFPNVTCLYLVDLDSDSAIILFQLLKEPVLSKIIELALQLKDDRCNSMVIHENLKDMIENNRSLLDFSFYNIDVTILDGLANGLLSNQSLTVITLSVIDMDRISSQSVAGLLKALDCSVRLSKVYLDGLPPLQRSSTVGWHMEVSPYPSIIETMPSDPTSKTHYRLLPYFICLLTDVCANKSLASRAADSILLSCPKLKFGCSEYNLGTDITLITKLFNCLRFNSTLRELDLSGNQLLARGCDDKLCKAIEIMLSENKSLEKLNLSESMNNYIATALVAGLEKNHTPRHLQLDAKSLKLSCLSKMIHFLENNSLKCLTITDIVFIQHFKPSKWQVKVFDGMLWPQILAAVMKLSPQLEILNLIRLYSDLECVRRGTPVEFEVSTERLHCQMPCRLLNYYHKGETFILPTSDDIKSLFNIKALTSISLSECNHISYKTVTDELSAASQLTRLDLSNSSVHENCVVELLQVLERDSRLEEFVLCNCKCSFQAFGVALESFLRKCKSILSLSLKSCSISDDVCKHIGVGIQHNSTLSFLDLSKNNITENGAMVLFTSLKHNAHIKELNLSGNSIFPSKEDLGHVLYHFLQSNVGLSILSLGYVNDNCLQAIAAGLERNSNLQVFALDCFSHDFQVILSLLMKNKLRYFNCSDILSFTSTESAIDTKWKIEVNCGKFSQPWSLIFQELHQAGFDSCEISISPAVSALDLTNCYLSFAQIVSIVNCLEHNVTLKSFRLQISKHFKSCNYRDIGCAIGNMLANNSSLAQLQLIGVVQDTIVDRITTTLISRTCQIMDLWVEVTHLCNDSVIHLMKLFDTTRISQIVLNCQCEHQTTQDPILMICINRTSTGLIVKCFDIDDVLAISLFSFLQLTTCQLKSLDLSNNVQLIQLGDVVSPSFKEMLYKKTIEELYLYNSESDCMIMAIASVLRTNHCLQRIHLNVLRTSHESLCSLLASLCDKPLVVRIKELDGCCSLCFMTRSTGEDLRDRNFNVKKYLPTTISNQHRSYGLDRVLTSLMDISCKLQDIEIHVSTSKFLSQETVLCNEKLGTLLRSTPSLKTLKLCNPLSNPDIQRLAAGLKENCTLNHLALSMRTQKISDIAPVFLTLNSNNVTMLEIIDEFLLFRDNGNVQWKLEIVRHSPVMSSNTLNELNKVLRGAELQIISIIDRHVRCIMLNFPDSDEGLNYTILKSIENGCYKVKELILTFGTKSYSQSYPQSCGTAIERMLASRCNKFLKKLRVVDLRNDIIAMNVVAGISQNTSLSHIYVKDQQQYLQGNYFVQRLLSVHLENSSICNINICDDIHIQRKVRSDSSMEHEDTTFNDRMCDVFSEVMWRKYERYDDNGTELPDDGSWVVLPTDKKNILPIYFLCNNVEIHSASTVSIGSLISRYLRKVDLSHSHLSCKQLAFLFESLRNNSSVFYLDVSFTLQEVPLNLELEMHSSFQRMLEENSALTVLNLTGIVDDKIVAILGNTLHMCYLRSLLINLNPCNSNFDSIQKLLCSSVKHDQFLLQIANVCSIHMHRKVNPEYTLCHVNLLADYVVSKIQQTSTEELFQSWLALYVLLIVGRHVSELALTVGDQVSNSLIVKVFQLFFSCVKSNTEHCPIADLNAAENFILNLNKLHLNFTAHSKDLFAVIVDKFQNVMVPSQLSLFHDSVCCEDQTLLRCYQMMLSSSTSLDSISFNGKFTESIANAVVRGLDNNVKLNSLTFGVSLLPIDTLVDLLQSVYESAIICVHITEGCCMKRSQRKQPFVVNFSGDQMLLCKMFCASAQVTQKHIEFIAPGSCVSSKELDLSKGSWNDHGSIDCASVFTVTNKGFVNTLILSNNKIVFDPHLLLSNTSVLKELRLDNCHITDYDCEHIARGLTNNSCLCILDLHSNDITGYGAMLILRTVTDNYTLTVLDISDNDLCLVKSSSPSISGESQSKNNSLLKLCLGLCNPLCINLRFQLHMYSSLKLLSVQIKDEELLTEILYSLENSQCLEDLDIAESSVRTLTTAYAIQQLLQNNCTIKTLIMHSCGISDDTCKLFARGLTMNKHLEKLDISQNNICGHGVFALFQSLEENKCSLVDLNLSSNWKHGTLSIDEFEDSVVLSKNSSLKTLMVSDMCGFGLCLGKKIFSGLKTNSTLHTLDMSDNVVYTDAFDVFVNMLSCNSTLSELNITWTEFFVWNYNLANALLKCSSLKTLTVDPVMGDILKSQNEALNKNVSVTVLND